MSGVRRSRWARLNVVGGVALVILVVARLGTGPLLDGLRAVDGRSLALATGVAALTTLCGAWRWCLVSRALGLALPLPAAVAAYYRSQFLNTVLPGGILGDVHRAVHHGRHAGALATGARAVAWERTAGQTVQVATTLAVLTVVPSPVRAAMPVAVAAIAGAAAVAAAVVAAPQRRRTSRLARIRATVRADLRVAVVARDAWPGIVATSLVVVAGHTATFVIAARAAGSTVGLDRLLPLAMLILLVAALPTNVGGWGPREGIAAWSFAAAGLGAGQGLAAGTAYGILALVACLPGALVTLGAWLARRDAVTGGAVDG